MSLSYRIRNRIGKYQPEGGLDQTARLVLNLLSQRHEKVLMHVEGVALLTEEVCRLLKMDAKAGFFAALLHDTGKLVLPYDLFDGRNITAEEYAEVKSHALAGFNSLADHHLFISLCAGVHHNMYKHGYGLEMSDFPTDWSPATIKKVLDISAVVSICDFIDAYTHRETKIKDGSDSKSKSLRDMLREKYPNDHNVIDVALKAQKQLNL